MRHLTDAQGAEILNRVQKHLGDRFTVERDMQQDVFEALPGYVMGMKVTRAGKSIYAECVTVSATFDEDELSTLVAAFKAKIRGAFRKQKVKGFRP